jgi:hypothetical protein
MTVRTTRATARTWRPPPPVSTLAVLVLGGCTALLLGIGEETATNATFVRSVSWQTWKITAAVAVAAWVVLMSDGISRLSARDRHGLEDLPGSTVAAYVASAALLAGLVLLLLVVPDQTPFEIDVPAFRLRTRTLVAVAATCAVPWVALVWLSHREVAEVGRQIEAAEPEALTAPREDGRTALQHLLRLWGLVADCVRTFAVFVATALLTSGALRLAFLAQAVEDDANPARRPDAFPHTHVLLFGLFFSVVLAGVALPLVAAWRDRAQLLVERRFPLPPEGLPTAEWEERRKRLSGLLGLDVGLLRDPTALVGLLTPLITAGLATFLPEIAQ